MSDENDENDENDEDEFLPDIKTYLERTENKKSVSIKGLETLIAKLQASTGLSKEASSIITKLFFQEVRNAVLRGEKMFLYRFGTLFVSCPKNSKNVNRIFLKFNPFKKIIKKLNDR